MQEYKGFQGHIILLCKNHYGTNIKTSIIEKLKMIWAIRCGYEYNEKDNSSILSIINGLHKIIYPTIKDHKKFQEDLHEYLLSWLHGDSTTHERLILFYVSEISMMQIKDKSSNDKWKTLIKLPKPKKQLFNRILNGNGKYDDYYLIEPKTN